MGLEYFYLRLFYFNFYGIILKQNNTKQGVDILQTTTLHVDMIIIGAEGLTWIIALFSITESKIIDFLKSSLTGTIMFALTVIIFLCICYVIGIIIDRVGHFFLYKWRDKIRKKYGFNNSSEVYKAWQEKESKGLSYYDFIMSRERIIRGTILNLLPITITFTILSALHGLSLIFTLLIAFIGSISFVFCLWLYPKMINDYYRIIKDFKGVN